MKFSLINLLGVYKKKKRQEKAGNKQPKKINRNVTQTNKNIICVHVKY